jgi:DNA ligase-associated metallophosphoesterase
MKAYFWNDLTLLPERAVWREANRTLFVADVHIGKAAAFRAAGLPAPAGTTLENLARLDALIDRLAPRRLVVLGDLFHARAAFREATLREFAAWRARRPSLALTLVLGNHDIGAGAPPPGLDLDIVDEPCDLEGLECRHTPRPDDLDGPICVAGHLHPTTRLYGPGRDSLRLSCFVLRPRQLILPAFGEFTGGAPAEADGETSLCIVAGERLLLKAASAARPARRG